MIVILLCAGMGKRMGSPLPKPLVSFCGRSFVSRIAAQVQPLCDQLLLVIQERHKPLFEADLSPLRLPLHFVLQNDPQGTGHALALAVDFIRTQNLVSDRVLCLNGDMPLLSRRVLDHVGHTAPPHSNAIVGFTPPDPTGYGRITEKNHRIVEEKDCTPDQKKIRLVNAGIYLFSREDLLRVPVSFETNNAQHEVYITDYVRDLQEEGSRVHVVNVPVEWNDDLVGVNTRKELELLELHVLSFQD